jgi:hypothetical protein
MREGLHFVDLITGQTASWWRGSWQSIKVGELADGIGGF